MSDMIHIVRLCQIPSIWSVFATTYFLEILLAISMLWMLSFFHKHGKVIIIGTLGTVGHCG